MTEKLVEIVNLRIQVREIRNVTKRDIGIYIRNS